MIQWLVIAAATLVSEDITCISTGLLIRQDMLTGLGGVAACFAGIFLGDMGLWMLGRCAGRAVLRQRWLGSRLTHHRIAQWGSRIDQHCAAAVISSRFVPGTRLPMYFAAGTLGHKPWRFVGWSFLACAMWTPLAVGVTALLGPEVVRGIQHVVGSSLLALCLGVPLIWLAWRFSQAVSSAIGRAQLIARLSRMWRWEFWPVWLFYLPLMPHIGWLSLKHRGFSTITAANPGIPHGGFVGESKFEILSRLPSEFVVPSELLPPDEDILRRIDRLNSIMAMRTWSFPLVFKPDAGQRGVGVKLIHSINDAMTYLADNARPVLIQVFHPGPYEAGIFYCRMPNEKCGRILSITDKKFPILIGDGRSTIEQLIWLHPRFRMQAHVFLKRLAQNRDRILDKSQPLQLALAGNHCQGTMFCDGAQLLTPELSRVIDRIAQSFEGFHFGRFDVRYRNARAFMEGKDLAIVELNGATSESTNIYDPRWSLIRAYRALMRQWSTLFEIGAYNRGQGHHSTRLRELARAIRSHYRDRQSNLVAD